MIKMDVNFKYWLFLLLVTGISRSSCQTGTTAGSGIVNETTATTMPTTVTTMATTLSDDPTTQAEITNSTSATTMVTESAEDTTSAPETQTSDAPRNLTTATTLSESTTDRDTMTTATTVESSTETTTNTSIISLISRSVNISKALEANNQTAEHLFGAVLRSANLFLNEKVQSFVSGVGGQLLLRSALVPNQLGLYGSRINTPNERKAIFYSILLNVYLNEGNQEFLTNVSTELANRGELAGEKYLPNPDDARLLELACSSNPNIQCITVATSTTNTGLIVGVTVGGVLLILLVSAVVWYCCTKQTNGSRVDPDHRSSIEMSSSAPKIRDI